MHNNYCNTSSGLAVQTLLVGVHFGAGNLLMNFFKNKDLLCQLQPWWGACSAEFSAVPIQIQHPPPSEVFTGMLPQSQQELFALWNILLTHWPFLQEISGASCGSEFILAVTKFLGDFKILIIRIFGYWFLESNSSKYWERWKGGTKWGNVSLPYPTTRPLRHNLWQWTKASNIWELLVISYPQLQFLSRPRKADCSITPREKNFLSDLLHFGSMKPLFVNQL